MTDSFFCMTAFRCSHNGLFFLLWSLYYRLLVFGWDRLFIFPQEPIHQNPICQLSIDETRRHGNKFLSILFPPGVVTASTAPELSSYCNDGEDDEDEVDGTKRRQRRRRLDLQAPSRLFRESFLLALGIAIISGNISGLGTKTILNNCEIIFVDRENGK